MSYTPVHVDVDGGVERGSKPVGVVRETDHGVNGERAIARKHEGEGDSSIDVAFEFAVEVFDVAVEQIGECQVDLPCAVEGFPTDLILKDRNLKVRNHLCNIFKIY